MSFSFFQLATFSLKVMSSSGLALVVDDDRSEMALPGHSDHSEIPVKIRNSEDPMPIIEPALLNRIDILGGLYMFARLSRFFLGVCLQARLFKSFALRVFF